MTLLLPKTHALHEVAPPADRTEPSRSDESKYIRRCVTELRFDLRLAAANGKPLSAFMREHRHQWLTPKQLMHLTRPKEPLRLEAVLSVARTCASIRETAGQLNISYRGARHQLAQSARLEALFRLWRWRRKNLRSNPKLLDEAYAGERRDG